MSQSDFRNRLDRLDPHRKQGLQVQDSTARWEDHYDPPQTDHPPKRQVSRLKIILLRVVMILFLQPLVFLIKGFDSLRNHEGFPIILLVVIICLVISGLMAFKQANLAVQTRADQKNQRQQKRPRKQGSRPVSHVNTKAKNITSLIGLALGLCLIVMGWIVSKTYNIGTDQANTLTLFFGSAALTSLVVCVTLSLVAIFIRGYALGRVPIYFLIGILAGTIIVAQYGETLLARAPLIDVIPLS